MPNRYESYIAKKLFFSTEATSSGAKPAVHVALIGIIVGIAVMLLSLCIVIGFKSTVTDKVAGFGAHLQIVNFDNNNTYELQPIAVPDSLLLSLGTIDHVSYVTPFATKPSILKTDSSFQGIILKGLPIPNSATPFQCCDLTPWHFYATNLVTGDLPNGPKEVLLSASLARLLNLETGDDLMTWFVSDESVRVRRFVISGLYETGLSEFDKLFVLGDIEVIRQLNGWTPSQASGIEVAVDDLDYLFEVDDAVFFRTANRLDLEGNGYHVRNLIQMNPQIFAWLDLLDANVIIIILLMLAVSGFSIISGLIILILDSVPFIGTLKALGADDGFIRRVFRRQAAWLIGKGVLIGNAIGLGGAALEYFTHWIPLEAETYYVSYVPIAFPWLLIGLLNVGTIIVTALIIIGPSYIVTRISPAQTLRFE